MRTAIGRSCTTMALLGTLGCVKQEPVVEQQAQLEPPTPELSVEAEEQPKRHWLDELDDIHSEVESEPAKPEPGQPPAKPAAPPKSSRPNPGPPSPRYGPIPAGHLRLEAISQAPVFLDEGLWFADGDRPLLYAETLDGCALFDLASGRIISRSDQQIDALCNLWLTEDQPPPPDGRSILWPNDGSHDGALLVENDGSSLHIMGPGEAERSLDCSDCSYSQHAFSPKDHRIAALSYEPLRVDIWNAETGKRLERFALSAPGEVNDAKLAWNERGVVVLVEHIEYADADDDNDFYEQDLPDVSAWFWPGTGAIERRLRLFKGQSLTEVDIDPHARWAFVYRSTQSRGKQTRRLTTVALTDQTSGLDWTWIEPYDDYDFESDDDDDYVDSSEDHDHWWRADASTQLLETRIDSTQKGSKVSFSLTWRALVTEPDAGVHARQVHRAKNIEEDDASPMLRLYGFSGKSALVEWAEDEFAERIRGSVLELGNCLAIDASPDLRTMLARCGEQEWGVFDLETLHDARGGRLISLDVDPKGEHAWGRSGWLAARGSTGKLVLVDPGARAVRLDRVGVEALVPLALGPGFDRLAIRTADGVELIDGLSGKTLLALPRFEGRAGLDPDGKRIAYIEGGQVHVVEIASGKPLASWAEPEWTDVAWRQDGAALLLGFGIPVFVVDASDGKPIASLAGDAWDSLDAADVDPSWRWAYVGDDRIVRTLDGMGMEFGPDWVRLDCGLVEGSIDARSPELRDYAYRAGDDVFAVPRISAAAAHPYIVRKGVTAAFFAGETITPPSVPKSKAH